MIAPVAFPFSALVGMEELQLALLLGALDRRIGGVLVRGDKGSAKTTAARGLAALLPGNAPFVELPLGATEDRVVGSFDVRAALGTGEYRYRPGLLESADGGVLYVDEVNLLADHLVDLLLDAAATGSVRVERDGVSETRRARFVLVGSMNPEEGELRPQLLDRFGLSVLVATPSDPAARAEAVRRRLAFDRDPDGTRQEWEDAQRALADRLATGRPARLPHALTEHVAALCAAAGAEGLRADLVVCRAAAALAGWEGREEATVDDVRRVAPLALAHRRRSPWEPVDPRLFDPSPGHTPPPDPSPASSSSSPASSTSSVSSPASSSSSSSSPTYSELGGEAPTAPETSASAGGGAHPASGDGAGSVPHPDALPSPPAGGRGPGAETSPPPAPSLDAASFALGAARRRNGTAVDAARGRHVGSRVPHPERALGTVDAPGTLLAAAARRRPPGPVRVEEQDLREPVRRQVPPWLVVMVVDASGSMRVRERLAAARGAVLALLVDAYQRRDRVALVTFRGETAETVLRPTGSTEVARARLQGMATGGRTPLAAGIRHGLALATGRRHAVDRPLLVVVSDGRATWAADGEDPLTAALAAAAGVKAAGVDALVVDCEGGRQRLGLAHALAEAMGAPRVAVGDLTGEKLAAAVRAALP